MSHSGVWWFCAEQVRDYVWTGWHSSGNLGLEQKQTWIKVDRDGSKRMDPRLWHKHRPLQQVFEWQSYSLHEPRASASLERQAVYRWSSNPLEDMPCWINESATAAVVATQSTWSPGILVVSEYGLTIAGDPVDMLLWAYVVTGGSIGDRTADVSRQKFIEILGRGAPWPHTHNLAAVRARAERYAGQNPPNLG